MALNRPWTVQWNVKNDWYLPDGAFSWLVLDKWGVVIARFDRADRARACVKAVNKGVPL